MATTVKNNKKQSAVKKSNYQAIAGNRLIDRYRLLLLALLGIVIFYPPFLRGLYFEDEQLPTEIFVFVVFIAFQVYKQIKHDKKFIKTPLEYVSFGFAIVYLVSITVAVGTREAIGEWLKYCMYFAVFIMLSELLATYKSKIAMLWVLVASSLCVSVIGIDGIAGGRLANVLNSAFKALGYGRDMFFGIFVTNRINSTFQYPNATAAYLMAVFFIAATLVMVSPKVYLRLVAGVSSYIILITFMLTLSRGAVLFMPVVGVMFILMQAKGYKLKSVISIIPAGIGMLLTVTRLTNIMANPEGNGSNVWKYFILGIAATVVAQIIFELAGLALNKLTERDGDAYNKIKVAGYIFCGLAVILLIVGSILVVTTKAPLVLSHASGQADSVISVRRSFILQPDKEYKLIYNVQSSNTKDKPNAYSITVASRDFSGIINGVDKRISTFEDKATNGFEQKEVEFKVPSNSKAVSITFINNYEGTSAEFKDAKIVPVDASEKEKEITLKYKYVPESIYARIDDAKETKSGIERTIYAKNGFEIFKDHPILGGGGGSWPLQYFGHQSYLYYTTQAHNYPVQVAIETGILGMIVLVGLWVVVIFQVINFIKKWKVDRGNTGVLNAGVMAACLALIMHSFADFDLSLSAIYLVLWELLAIVNSDVLYEKNESTDNRIVEKLVYEIKTIKFSPVITAIAIFIITIFPIIFKSGLNSYNSAKLMNKQNNLTGSLSYLSKAISSDSISPKYKADYIDTVLKQDSKNITQNDIVKMGQYAKDVENAGEHNIDIAIKLASYYMSAGNEEKGRHYLDKATELGPFRTDMWEQTAVCYYQMAQIAKNSGDTKSSDKYLSDLLKLSDEVKKVSQKSMLPFTMTPTAMELVERVNLLQDKENPINQTLWSKSVFYSLNSLDVDGNGIIDAWNDTDTSNFKQLKVDGNKLTAESLSGKLGVLQSRKIKLSPGKTYVISVELENYNDVNEIMVTMNGQNDQLKLVKSGTVYTAQINTAAGSSVDPLTIGLVVNGKYVIKNALIFEK